MINRSQTATAILVLAATMIGCGDSRRRLIPTGPSATPPGTPPLSSRLSGSVNDTAFRPVSGVRIEAMDGPAAGVFATSLADGSFVLTGAFDESVTFRASKAGFVTTTATQTRGPLGNYLLFRLVSAEPPATIVGNFMLTMTADPSCQLPEVMRSRSYPVTVVPSGGLHGFSISMSAPPFLSDYRVITIGVSGSHISMFFGGDFGSLAEELAPDTYAHFDAYASVDADTSTVESISVPLDGLIEHCQLQQGTQFSYTCSNQLVSRASCQSKNHRLTLTRR